MEEKKAFVYMLTNDRDNVLYIGSTKISRRIFLSTRGVMIAGFTQKYNVNKLVYFEEHADMESAERREKQLKGKSRAKKDKIVISTNPQWVNLA